MRAAARHLPHRLRDAEMSNRVMDQAAVIVGEMRGPRPVGTPAETFADDWPLLGDFMPEATDQLHRVGLVVCAAYRHFLGQRWQRALRMPATARFNGAATREPCARRVRARSR